MDLQGSLGYETQAGLSCTQCHEPKGAKPFVEFHDKHVRSEGLACAQCHDFSRPLPGAGGARRRPASKRSNR